MNFACHFVPLRVALLHGTSPWHSVPCRDLSVFLRRRDALCLQALFCLHSITGGKSQGPRVPLFFPPFVVLRRLAASRDAKRGARGFLWLLLHSWPS